MITIERPKIESAHGMSRLEAKLSVDGKRTSLWFEVEEKYGKFLCAERCDAFVLGLVLWAQRHGHDIQTDVPMTERLYTNYVKQFLPAFYRMNCFTRETPVCGRSGGYETRIVCPVAPELPQIGDGAIGTGVSTGVDSLHVFAMHPEISHGCLWTGIGANSGASGDSRSEAWERHVEHSKAFLEYIRKDLIVGRTNFFDDGSLPGLHWADYTTIGNLFCVFALQRMWSRYYLASGYEAEHCRFKISGVAEDPAHYEFFMLPYVSIGHLSLLVEGADKSRIEKTRDLLEYEPSQKFLNTCYRWDSQGTHRNCSCHCPKCMRTMLGLFALRALDRFENVYDIEYFKTHLEQYIAELYRGYLQHNNFILELKPYMRHCHVPFRVRLAAFVIVIRKALRKVFRLGKTGGAFSPT